jgi:putative membrane protein
MMHWYWPMGSWGYVLMTLSMVVFWGLLIAGGIALFRYLGRSGARPEIAPTRTPEQILDERFARGELDEDEYRQRLDTLRSARPASRA